MKLPFRNERSGLTMIFASLVVIGVIVVLLFGYQQESRESQIRAHGIGLVRLLGGMSWEQLVLSNGRQGPLQIMRESQNDPDFAYGAVVDIRGRPETTVSAPGVIIPPGPLPREPSSWLGERILQPGNDGRPFIEFHAPVFSGGELNGYVRLGYFKPGGGVSYQQMPFFASLALPIFLLTPLFYFLMRREVRPLQQASRKVEELISEGGFAKLELNASGELSEFMGRFNSFVDLARQRIHQLEQEQNGLVTSTKLLSYRQSRVEVVLQTLPEAVVVLDQSGLASYSNSKLEALLGVDGEQVIGHRPSEWCDNPKILTYLARYEGSSGGGFSTEPLCLSPTHSPDKTLEMNAYPLFSPRDESELLGTLILFRDVTEEQVARNNRGEFVAQVAHELKTPLNVLAMYSESLLGEEGEAEEFRIEATNVIHDEVERLSTLINNLLAITRVEMGGMQLNRQRIRLSDLLEDAFSNVTQSGRGRDLKFQLDLPREMSAVFVDKDLLRIAVNNLLTNAIKYNRPGGTVTLEARETENEIEVSVRDNGIGIAPKEQAAIFDKFYRSDDEQVRAQTGHGLGLPLVQQIVQLHHAELKLESTPGKGSSFVIRLNKGSDVLPYAVSA